MNIPSYKDALEALRRHPSFLAVVTELVKRREDAIGVLGNYKDDAALKKSAAEVTVYTELLDEWEVPVGEAQG